MKNHPTHEGESKQQHTPTPWRKHDMEADSIVGPDRKAIALVMGRSRTDQEDDANLDFILTAVNSHQALVDALERAIQYVPANAVSMKEAASRPIAECRTLDFCRSALSSARQP